MHDAHVRIVDVSKRFGAVEALKQVSLDIPRGSFTTFLGPSGCGKTTLLRTIAGFYRLKEGKIYLGDRLINDVPSHQRNAVMVFQDYALFPHMSIGDNIAYGLKIRKMPAQEISAKVTRTAEYLGIRGLEARHPGEISGGQQQRVALARALVMEPEVLLLDEPLSNLDAKLRMNIRAELRQIQRNLGITTIYVTHDQAEALSLSDQIAVMQSGRVVQLGSPREIYYKPLNTFVADFVGTANLLKAQVVENTNGHLTVGINGARIGIAETTDGTAVGDTVTVCVRPETIEVRKEGSAEQTNVLEGEIVNSIFEGAQMRYWMNVADQQVVVDVFDPSSGELLKGSVLLYFPPEKIHIIANV